MFFGFMYIGVSAVGTPSFSRTGQENSSPLTPASINIDLHSLFKFSIACLNSSSVFTRYISLLEPDCGAFTKSGNGYFAKISFILFSPSPLRKTE
jgi:hypothetical protein